MFEASAASEPRPLPPPAPSLTRVEPQTDPFTEAIAPRAISLGGPGTGALSTFTISARLQGRSILTDTDLTRDEITEVLDTAVRLKKMRQAGQPHGYLAGKSLGMIFQHPSTRTRVSFEAGMAQLGGQAIFLGVHDLQIKRGESLADTAQVLSRYVDGIAARVAAHGDIEEIAAASSVPVLNGLSDRWHPMQALSDLLTMQEVFGGFPGRKVAYLGDGNNMVHSLLLACSAMGMSVSVASPQGYQPDPEVVNHARWLAATSGHNGEIVVTDDPFVAAAGADAIYTDVHVSMGQTDAATRAVALAPYKVTRAVMDVGEEVGGLHALPADAPRPGSGGGGGRRPALDHLRPGGESAPPAKGGAPAHAQCGCSLRSGDVMQTVIDGQTAMLTGSQVHSWIDDDAARAAAPGLRRRSILSDLDLSRAEVDALVETALWLEDPAGAGSATSLPGREDARHDLPAPQHAHARRVPGGNGAARRPRHISGRARPAIDAGRDVA